MPCNCDKILNLKFFFRNTCKGEDNDHQDENNANHGNQSHDIGASYRIDVALAIFFYACNIPFNVIDSPFFHQFVKALNPEYRLFARKKLSESLLNFVYRGIIAVNTREIAGKDVVLLGDGWTNKVANTKHEVLTICDSEHRQIFLESYDVSTTDEMGTKSLTKLLKDGVAKAQEMYGANVVCVMSDNEAVMLSSGRALGLWQSSCSSHSANLLAKAFVPKDFAHLVNNLLSVFKQPQYEPKLILKGGKKIQLAIDVRWNTYRDCFVCAKDNLMFMREMACEPNFKFKDDELRGFLFSDRLDYLLNYYINIFDPICRLINTCQQKSSNTSDAVHSWLTLKIPEDDVQNLIDQRISKALWPISYAAYLLNPKYDFGALLNDEQRNEAYQFILKNLNDIGQNEFLMFCRQEGIFNELINLKLTSPQVFWNLASRDTPTFAAFAKKLYIIPASTANLESLFSNWQHIHNRIRNRLTTEKSKKLITIYYTMRVSETCGDVEEMTNSILMHGSK